MRDLKFILSEFDGHIDEARIKKSIQAAFNLGQVLAKTKSAPYQVEGAVTSAEEIEQMLLHIETELTYTHRKNSFIESLRDQFDDRRTLSPKQIEALRSIYART